MYNYVLYVSSHVYYFVYLRSSGSSRPFTAYSSKLGGVISELHRSLLEFISKEKRAMSLTQAVKVMNESAVSDCTCTSVSLSLSVCLF